MAIYRCSVCDTEFNEEKEGRTFDQLDEKWACHVCDSGSPTGKRWTAVMPDRTYRLIREIQLAQPMKPLGVPATLKST